MKGRAAGESDEAYIKRLEAANDQLRKNNKEQSKYAAKVARAVTWLSCEASLAFQAMAEKAGVRGHPSVTEVVKMFDTIAHPQWTPDDAAVQHHNFPSDWDLDQSDNWSGDADMQMNSGVSEALEFLEGLKFAQASRNRIEEISKIQAGLERPIQGILEKVRPELAARNPISIPDEATRDDLAHLINDISWRALDLAQDMSSTNLFLRRDLRAAAYRRICSDLYEMSNLHVPIHNDRFDIKVIGDETPF